MTLTQRRRDSFVGYKLLKLVHAVGSQQTCKGGVTPLKSTDLGDSVVSLLTTLFPPDDKGGVASLTRREVRDVINEAVKTVRRATLRHEKRGDVDEATIEAARCLWGWLVCCWAAFNVESMAKLAQGEAALAHPMEDLMRQTIGDYLTDIDEVDEVCVINDEDDDLQTTIENDGSGLNTSPSLDVKLNGNTSPSLVKLNKSIGDVTLPRNKRSSIQAMCSRLSVTPAPSLASPLGRQLGSHLSTTPNRNHPTPPTGVSRRPPRPLPHSTASKAVPGAAPKRVPTRGSVAGPELTPSNTGTNTGTCQFRPVRRSLSSGGPRPSTTPSPTTDTGPRARRSVTSAGVESQSTTHQQRRTSLTHAQPGCSRPSVSPPNPPNHGFRRSTSSSRPSFRSASSGGATGNPSHRSSTTSTASTASTSQRRPTITSSHRRLNTSMGVVVEELRKENLSLAMEVRRLEQTVSELEMEKDDSGRCVNKLNSEASKLGDEMDQQRDMELALHGELNGLKMKLKDVEVSLRREKAKNKSLNEMLSTVTGVPVSDSIDDAVAAGAAKDAELTSLRSKVESLRRALTEKSGLKDRLSEVEEENSSLNKRVIEMAEEAKKDSKIRVKLMSEVSYLEKMNEKKKIAEAALDEEKVRCETQLRTIEQLRDKTRYNDQQIAELRDAVRQLTLRGSTDEISGDDLTGIKLNDMRKEIESLKVQLSEARDIGDASSNTCEHHKDSNDEIKAMRLEYTDLEERHSALQHKLALVSSERDVFEVTLSEKDFKIQVLEKRAACSEASHTQHGDRLSSDVDHYKTLLLNVEERYEEMSKVLEEQRKQGGCDKEVIDAQGRRIEQMVSEIDRLKLQVEAERGSNETLKIEIDNNWKSKVEALEREVDTVKSRADQETSSKAMELMLRQEKASEIDDLTTKLTRLQQRLTTATKSLHSAEDETSKLRHQLSDSSTIISTLKQDVERVESERDRSIEQTKTIQTQLRDVNHTLLKHKAEVDEINNKYNQERQRSLRLSGELTELERELDLALGGVETEDNNERGGRGGRSDPRQSNRDACLASLIASNKELVEEVNKLKSENEELKTGMPLSASQREVDRCVDIDMLQAHVTALTIEKDRLKQQVRQRDWSKSETEEAYRDLHQKHMRLKDEQLRLIKANRKLQKECPARYSPTSTPARIVPNKSPSPSIPVKAPPPVPVQTQAPSVPVDKSPTGISAQPSPDNQPQVNVLINQPPPLSPPPPHVSPPHSPPPLDTALERLSLNSLRPTEPTNTDKPSSISPQQHTHSPQHQTQSPRTAPPQHLTSKTYSSDSAPSQGEKSPTSTPTSTPNKQTPNPPPYRSSIRRSIRKSGVNGGDADEDIDEEQCKQQ
eukprot:GHVN01083577.1.p1 GENE.GHVN01083577.1~~GHVN01083577.1.p1  ORF type:complete len:1362 (+),score=430.92 GHVN01083577.1:372-4457(+)